MTIQPLTPEQIERALMEASPATHALLMRLLHNATAVYSRCRELEGQVEEARGIMNRQRFLIDDTMTRLHQVHFALQLSEEPAPGTSLVPPAQGLAAQAAMLDLINRMQKGPAA